MKRAAPFLVTFVLLVVTGFRVFAETETIDLKALAKKARPAVMLLVVSDAAGKEIATGTGFLVSSDGKLITNHHVIEKAASAVAKAENGGLFPVEGVLADDPKNDLVLLKLKGKDLPFLTLGDSAKIEVGTRIAVIGSPLGLEGTLSEGIVSAVRDVTREIRIMQITAAISAGSSGSPVLDSKGDVIGVARALVRGGQSLNFAVPVAPVQVLLINDHKTSTVQNLSAAAAGDALAFLLDAENTAAFDALIAGDNAAELKHTQALVRRYPDNPDAHLALGDAYTHLKFYDDAIASYQQAIKLKPEYSHAWSCLGSGYQMSDMNSDAIAAYQQAIRLDPNNDGAWFGLGDVYYKLGRRSDGDEAYEHAIKITKRTTEMIKKRTESIKRKTESGGDKK